jgi:hypothetical protein
VLAVNPEPGVEHIWPGQLRDARVADAPAPDDPAGWDRIAARVAAPTATLPGPLGRIVVLAQPVWYGAMGLGSTRFVGRIPDLWRVHSALSAPLVPLVSGQHGPAVAQLRGLGGIGKSLLAEEYALRFAAAYPGGVFWLRAHGSDAIGTGWTAEQRHADRHAQLAALAAARGLPIDRSDPTQVLAALRHSIGADGRRCLWVVDDVPDQLDADELLDWVAPHPLAATMLTTRSRRYGALATPVDLDVLDPDDGYQLLTAHRLPTDPDEKDAARGLVADLGGHALALDIAGAALATGAGLQSIADYRAALQDPASDELELAAELADALPTGH